MAMVRNADYEEMAQVFQGLLAGIVADEPKTTPCTFYSLFSLPRVIALKVEASSAEAAFDVCPF